MGTRANAQNLNINRDYMKLDTPEAKAFVKLWNDYDPQVGFDLHTSDGSAHGYYLTYSPPLNPDTEPRDHEDHDGRVVPVRDEEHEGEARVGLVLLRQRVDAGRRGGGRGRGAPGGCGGASGAGGPAASAGGATARPQVRGSGARSSTCRASTTTTSACATASRC